MDDSTKSDGAPGSDGAATSESADAAAPSAADPDSANDRAGLAARSVLSRAMHRLWALPDTRIASVAWPPVRGPLRRVVGPWHYWWHAHLLDLVVDAAIHRPRPGAASVADRLIRGIRLRNLGRWTNDYYDDMAWLGLALERADRHLDLRHGRAVQRLSERMHDAWEPDNGGGIPWRTLDTFFNAPANGPAAILLARVGDIDRASTMCDWMDHNLVDPRTHLVIDGVRPSRPGKHAGRLVPVTAIYTYCQGVVLGAEVETLRATRDRVHLQRIDRLLAAVERHLEPDGVIGGAGGGDGGLFMGILARYLAMVATDLPTGADDIEPIRHRAAHLVRTSADAAWRTRSRVDGPDGPRIVFSADWHRLAQLPAAGGRAAESVDGAVHSSSVAERDLSVQLSGWMVLEAAAAIELGRAEHATPTRQHG